ncbi:MAG: hypothetical protein WDZ44_01585 [Candidatus Spechtbacterales bacterium]
MNKLSSRQLFKKLYIAGVILISTGVILIPTILSNINTDIENQEESDYTAALDYKHSIQGLGEEFRDKRAKGLPYVVAKRFYSEDLGIEFTYALRYPDWHDQEINPVQKGSAVYVDALPGEGGHSVEVFTKDPSVSLEDALRRHFSLSEDCAVRVISPDEDTPLGQRALDLLHGYKIAVIDSPITIFEDLEGAIAMCSGYLQGRGVSYFMMNERVPDKFVFVSTGQYFSTSDGMYAPDYEGGDRSWEVSLRILH